MELQNNGDEPIVLVDGESPLFGHVEIHTMIMDEGVMRMRRLDELVIEPGQNVQLRPGGLHLMLIEPLGSLALGDTIDITLIDDQGERHTLVSEVRQRNRPSMVD
jgi:copper(I)-binding protein